MTLRDCRSTRRLLAVCLSLTLGATLFVPVRLAHAQPTVPGLPQVDPTESTGTVRLRQPAAPDWESSYPRQAATEAVRQDPAERATPPTRYVPGEFERYVQSQAGPDVEIRRFGSELVTAQPDVRGADVSPLVPADYVVAPGDEVLVVLWGSVDADLRLTVDRSGRIHVPRVGAIQVAGLRHDELKTVIDRRVAQVFRSFESSVSLGQLRGIRVFVTGFVIRPGAYTVNSLSTIVSALMRSGGPSAAGSFRDIELRRGNALVAKFDLYDLLLRGDRAADRIVQAGDVVHVGPVGTQVGFLGSVNNPAVLELKAGETVADAMRMAGGFSAVADRSRLAVERLRDRNSGRVVQIELPADEKQVLAHGDLVRAFSAVASALPTQRQAKRVKVEGEVIRPGEYVLPESSSVSDAIRAAGGFTGNAFLYATEFTRLSVRKRQQENYDRALRDLETDLARTSSSRRISSSDEAASQEARASANSRLVERLRALRPNGRMVLQLGPDATELPDLALEDGDTISVPARPSTIGVFGSVFNAASYLYQPGRSVQDYLRLAGGPTRGADERSIFVVRANGNVVSSRQSAGWLRTSGDFASLVAEPGDSIFVPEEMDKTTFAQAAKDWTQILYQFGLGIAGLVSVTR